MEPYLTNHTRSGWIEVICGSMFSGKTEELIRRVNRALIARQEVAIFKPLLDSRYDEVKVVSHNRTELHSNPISDPREMLLVARNCHVIGVDEAQFFDDSLPEVCEALAKRGKRIIVSGLDMDFEGKPFGVLPHLMAIAEFITKVHAVCVQCGGMASFSYRLAASRERVLLGEKEAYEPRCRHCFYLGEALPKKEAPTR
ncbi:MAG: thymidine kinase [Bernardetiaceae bacterium]|jgi:thymidine kinase|nr:thymidine kinase [Bernardetiaceae bacterium]